MAHPHHHAISSARKWGGAPGDYLPIHDWFDATKAHHADFRHRALRHHAEGIFLMEQVFGPTLTLSTCASCGKARVAHEVEQPSPHTALVSLSQIEAEGGRFDPDHYVGGCGDWRPKVIPTRWVGEQHVTEDLGRIPAATEWLSAIAPAPWMTRSRKLSRELEQEVRA